MELSMLSQYTKGLHYFENKGWENNSLWLPFAYFYFISITFLFLEGIYGKEK